MARNAAGRGVARMQCHLLHGDRRQDDPLTASGLDRREDEDEKAGDPGDAASVPVDEPARDDGGIADRCPGRVVQQQADDLGEREHERQVEEQLDGVSCEVLARFGVRQPATTTPITPTSTSALAAYSARV